MKKLILISAIATILGVQFSGVAQADSAKKPAKKAYSRQYGMAGCGLGSMVIGKEGSQVFAATTNGTSYSQTFGITSGTSNCETNGMAEVASRMDRFVVANEVALADDISRGNGEALTSLAVLMNCSDAELVGSALQGNFKQIFPSFDVQPNVVTDSILTTIRQNDNLAATCKAVI